MSKFIFTNRILLKLMVLNLMVLDLILLNPKETDLDYDALKESFKDVIEKDILNLTVIRGTLGFQMENVKLKGKSVGISLPH